MHCHRHATNAPENSNRLLQPPLEDRKHMARRLRVFLWYDLCFKCGEIRCVIIIDKEKEGKILHVSMHVEPGTLPEKTYLFEMRFLVRPLSDFTEKITSRDFDNHVKCLKFQMFIYSNFLSATCSDWMKEINPFFQKYLHWETVPVVICRSFSVEPWNRVVHGQAYGGDHEDAFILTQTSFGKAAISKTCRNHQGWRMSPLNPKIRGPWLCFRDGSLL